MEPAPETCLYSQHIWKTSLQQVRYRWLVVHDHCLNRNPAVQGFIQGFFFLGREGCSCMELYVSAPLVFGRF